MRRISGAKDEIRTRDPDLGKVVLYQLSYFRITFCFRALPPDRNRDELLSQGLQKYNEATYIIKYYAFKFTFSLEINFLISFNFIKASTGVRVLISV